MSIDASGVWGQPGVDRNIHIEHDFTSLIGVTTVGRKLFVTDFANQRVVYWNNIPATNQAMPDGVIDHVSLGMNDRKDPSITAASMQFPYSVSSDGTRLAVADYGNHRVLIWNTIPTSKVPADVVS